MLEYREVDDVGSVDEVRFILSETKRIKVYVIVYDCDVVVRSVIYKEE